MEEAEIATDDYLDRDNPTSLFSLSPARMQQALESVTPHWFSKSEAELETQLKPDRVLALLRFALWQEYARAQDDGSRINLETVTKGICTLPYFYRRVLKAPIMTAWLVIPPHDYISLAKESLQLGMIRLREILDMPIYTKEGKPDTKVAGLMLKAIHLLDQRVHGSPTQRHEIKSLQVNANASMREVKELTAEANMDEIEARLEKIRTVEQKEELLLEDRPRYEEFKSGAIDVEAPKRRKKKLTKDF